MPRKREPLKTTIRVLVTLGLAQGLAYALPMVSSVLNAASYDAVASPGCWIAIFGNNLACNCRRERGSPIARHAWRSISRRAGLSQINIRVSDGLRTGQAIPVRLIYLDRTRNEITIAAQ